jgi:hypothetical protein
MIRNGICKHGHVLLDVGLTSEGRCAECRREISRRTYARQKARRGYVRGPYKRRVREEAAQ